MIEEIVNILALGIVVGFGLGFVPILVGVTIHGALKILKLAGKE